MSTRCRPPADRLWSTIPPAHRFTDVDRISMMNTTVRRGAVVVLLVLFAACGSSGPTSPTGTNPPPAVPAADSAACDNLSSLSGPSRTFIFDRELSYPVSDYTRNSRFVLYDNGAFVLQYPRALGRGAILEGTRTQTASSCSCSSGRAGASPAHGDATGTLKGDSLTVQYEEIMHHTDFEDAVYVLMP